jgi:hypothetical protein
MIKIDGVESNVRKIGGDKQQWLGFNREIAFNILASAE